jgi:hypothetical protein
MMNMVGHTGVNGTIYSKFAENGDMLGVGIPLASTFPMQLYKSHNHNPLTFNIDTSHH